jgi:hypothetical protein
MIDVCQNTQDWAKAIDDANKCISIKPGWGKGYGRKGAALHGAGDLEGALKAYKDGFAVEPGANLTTYNICRLHVFDTNQPLINPCTGLAMLTNGLAEVTAQIRAEVTLTRLLFTLSFALSSGRNIGV